MRVLIFLCALAVSRARITQYCSGIDVRGWEYHKEVIKSGLDSPYQLAIDYDTNYLFFSFSTKNDTNDEFRSAYINMKTNEFDIIPNIIGGFGNTIDRKNHIVYLGGNNGIFTFDFTTKEAVFAGEKNVSIWQLYFKDKLYYTSYPNEKAYTFENGVSKSVPELESKKALLLAVDKNNKNIFYTSSKDLFQYNRNLSTTSYLGEYNVNGFTNDINDNLYFSTPDGLFAIDEEAGKVVRIAKLPNVYGIAMETDNNIIYSDYNSLIRLTSTTTECVRNGGDNKL